jgi:hypothetical protein
MASKARVDAQPELDAAVEAARAAGLTRLIGLGA